jgi:hypothetical protein
MARRRVKKRRSSRKKNVNLLRLAEAAVIGSIMTRNMAGTSLRNFVTNENPQDGVTFMELLRGSTSYTTSSSNVWGGSTTSTVGAMTAGGNLDVVWNNTKANAMPLIIGMIGTPIVFKFGKKFARPVLTPVRGLLKGSGVTV